MYRGYSVALVLEQGVNVTVDKIPGLIFFNEPVKNPEATVTWVFGIVDKSRRGMGYNQINSAASPETKAHLAYKPGHLFLCILIDVAIIPSRSAKAYDAYIPEPDESSVDGHTPLWRRLSVAQVVVAEDIIERAVKTMPERCQIFRGKVTTGNNEIDALYCRSPIW